MVSRETAKRPARGPTAIDGRAAADMQHGVRCVRVCARARVHVYSVRVRAGIRARRWHWHGWARVYERESGISMGACI